MRRPQLPALVWSFAVPALLLPLGGCGMTTYGTGQVPEMAMFREVSGGFLNRNEKKEPIEYQPRAPLVMPPATETAGAQLPDPVQTASAASPDWPQSLEDRIGDADARAEDDDPRNDVNQAEYRRLKPLAGVFSNAGARPTYELDESGRTEYYKIVHSKQKQGKEFKQALAEMKGYGRTERRYLTDPPMTYREPVATEPGTEPVVPKKKKNFLARWFPGT
jgi:hypothetical protein